MATQIISNPARVWAFVNEFSPVQWAPKMKGIGQERDDALHFNNDVKAQLIVDAGEIVRTLPSGVAHGILVTGDIAQAGKAAQYTDAGRWLDQLAEAVGCEPFRIQMVPGNHDLDRSLLSKGGTLMLDAIRAGGSDGQLLSRSAEAVRVFHHRHR